MEVVGDFHTSFLVVLTELRLFIIEGLSTVAIAIGAFFILPGGSSLRR
jgi:hypothetical protein